MEKFNVLIINSNSQFRDY